MLVMLVRIHVQFYVYMYAHVAACTHANIVVHSDVHTQPCAYAPIHDCSEAYMWRERDIDCFPMRTNKCANRSAEISWDENTKQDVDLDPGLARNYSLYHQILNSVVCADVVLFRKVVPSFIRMPTPTSLVSCSSPPQHCCTEKLPLPLTLSVFLSRTHLSPFSVSESYNRSEACCQATPRF